MYHRDQTRPLVTDLYLDIREPYVWKYVDDTTKSKIVPKDCVSNAQNIADPQTIVRSKL